MTIVFLHRIYLYHCRYLELVQQQVAKRNKAVLCLAYDGSVVLLASLLHRVKAYVVLRYGLLSLYLKTTPHGSASSVHPIKASPE